MTGVQTCALPILGDMVLFAKYSGTEVNHDEKEFLILKEDDILAVLKDSKK